MIQARKDGTTSSKEQKIEDKTTGLPAQRPATTVRAVHALDQRRATFVTSAVAGAPTAVILSEGSSITDGSTLQYRRVSLGPQLQHVVTPVQVQGAISATTASETSVANQRCTVTSTQDLTHILVATSTTNSSLHAVDLQNSVVTVAPPVAQPFQTLGNITNVVTSGQRAATPGSAQPQRIVLNSGTPDLYALRIAPSGSMPTQQIMVLDPASVTSDVTKVHSYSLASASLGQKIVISAPGGTVQQRPAVPLRTGVKRQLQLTSPARALTVNNNELVSHVCNVNKVLYGLVPYDGKMSSIPSSPKPKRIKLEKGTVTTRDPVKRKRVADQLTRKLQFLRTKYYVLQAEQFYLESTMPYSDYAGWRKKVSRELLDFLKCNKFDPLDDVKVISDSLYQANVQPIMNPIVLSPAFLSDSSKSPSTSSSHTQSPLRPSYPSPSSAQRSVSSPNSSKSMRQPFALHKHSSKHNSISSVYDLQIGSQEEIVERAKQEAYVMQRVGDLRKEGLWSLKRLPKVAETPRIKAHYDYLLEEMAWLATDFAQERKWKKAAAKKCARMITKYFQEKEIKAEKAEKEEQLRLRKIAGLMAREVKQFWNNIEKLAEYKQQTWLEEKRKKVLDVHLNFIVDQTEKYSSWLTQGMNRGTKDSPDSSRASTPLPESAPSSPRKKRVISHEPSDSDIDCDSNVKVEDVEMKLDGGDTSHGDLTESSEYLNTKNDSKLGGGNDSFKSNKEVRLKDKSKGSKGDDSDFEISEEEEDDEQTLLEQEKEEESVDHVAEIKELEEEGQMSIEELRAKYASLPSDFEMDSSEQMSVDNDGEDSDNISEDEKSEEKNESLLKMLTNEELEEEDSANPSKEISDIAATAESFQPKGNTLSTTQVCTKVPFLLKHSLREYQHIGLDWLNAMYEKKLNGILADEMGLGKTIQTISVLAHLACEKGVWGPHLIVVPTSVMLNWEMELKKWCPAFKILTYYGTPKERKQKRVGWTKPNAFHVCITSYKLVVQDHQSFRRKRWKYFILDEAHHIKNFKSQRWQMLLNFQSSHRLLLTGTPLQNNLMELWSLMHFLMPNVFQSHREFKEWFVNPFTGMIEGSHEYNESLIKRLHKVLRPFLLRRLKSEVEKQLPKKYEHVVVCRLSKRQRYLYDDFMSQTKTKETLATGSFMSVINILMQLRKVCNHPNMFEERPTVSPFLMEGISFHTASLAQKALEYDPLKQVNLLSLNLLLADLELSLSAFAAHRVRKFQVSRKLIVELDSMPEPPPSCPTVKMKVNFCNSQASSNPLPSTTMARVPPTVTRLPSSVPNRLSATVGPQPQRYMVIPGQSVARTVTPAVVSQPTEQYTLQLLQPGSVLPPPKVNNPIASPPFLSNRPQNNTATVSPLTTVHNRPVGRVAPFNGHPSSTPAESVVNQNHVQPTKSPVVHSLTKPAAKPDPVPVKKNSLFYLEEVITARENARKESLEALARINNQRCRACPIYGSDLVEAVMIMQNLKHPKCSSWTGPGYVNCLNAITCKDNPRHFWDLTETLSNLILTPEDRVCQLMEVISRFVFVVPAVTAPPIDLHVSHPAPSQVNIEEINNKRISEFLTPACAFLHPIVSNMKNQFPDLRLIQYDCGKLQMLAQLLWDLKKDHHRVLIFTQMTRMLDILEQFLNYHGHTYLRLDGNTKVEQRQALMERFNADKRIFCFILSTRSGGIGVNLTGADTVIFYDSDWNPTMDAQAQDRCHRIGQTRDVHIYRLISERTIEENILKKANQKRILGDLAIEGGNFTTAFFKKNTIHELFGLDVRAEMKKEEKKIEEIPEKPGALFSQTELEQALGMAEEESDLQAAQTASAEAVAELAEFDESIPLDNDSRDNEEKSPAEEELDKLMEQLTPVEKYALHFLESLQEPVGLEQLKLAEEEIEAQKKDWELGHLKALKEEEERRAGQFGDDDSPLYCSREASNQVYFSVNGQEEMPIWAPPTPPTNENDIYIDCSLAFWYEPSFMHEASLPPVFIKKEAKRLKLDPIVSAVATTRKQKVRKEDVVNVPRSLFDRPSAAIIKMRREMKLQKVKGLIVGGSGLSKPITTFSGLKQPPVLLNKPPVDVHQERPDWLVQEDWAILQVIQDLQGIPLNLTVLMPAQTPNWDLMSEGVQSITKNYRSAKSCRGRYENVIVPREEGKILYDTNPKKQKKTKGIYKTKNNRPMKTSQLYIQDNNGAFSKIGCDRFKSVMENAVKRKASERQIVTQIKSSCSKVLATALVESGISYDSPLTPMQIASNRAERIAREKQKNLPTATQTIPSCTTAPVQSAASQVTDQQIAAQRQVTQVTTVASATTNLITQQAVIASLAQSQQLQQVQLSKANLQPGTVTSVSLAKSLTSGIMVNTPTISATATLANLTKALGQAGVTSISTQGAAQNAAIAAALSNANLRNHRAATVTAAPTLTVQEMVAAANARAATSATPTMSAAPAVVSVANLAAVQLASQRLAGSTLSPATTAAAVAAVNLNSQSGATQRNIAQLQAIKQSNILRHKQEQQTLKQQHMKRLQSVPQQQQPKLAISTTVTLASQQRVPMKQSRPMTEAEMAQLMKRQQLQKQAQQVSITGGTLVKTVSAPLSGGTSSLTIPVSAVTMGGVNINVSVPQGKAGTAKAATTITNQQLRQLQLQQQMINQARKGNKVTANLTQLAKIPGKATGIPGSMNAVQIVQHNPQVGGTQQVKSLPTAIAVQQIQQAMKQAIPQNLPVVVTATPSLPGVQQTTSTALRGEPSSVKAQTTTLPSTTLTTSGVLKGGPAVVMGQQQTAAILQQVAASTAAGLAPVTLAVRAGQQQQVQIQVQPATPRLQLAAAQSPSILSADQPSPPTHVVINSVPVATTTATISQASAANVVHAAIQAAKQQVAAAQQKASPYTMRLRNPPK